MTNSLEISGFDHVGIRVTDIVRSLEFYGLFGFRTEAIGESGYAYELINNCGIRISLMANGETQLGPKNILHDEVVKYPGMTHAAFIVPNLGTAMEALIQAEITITEGPVIEDRRHYFFIRDPDGNVLEFNEILKAS